MQATFKKLFLIAILIFSSGSIYAASCSSFKTEIKYPDGSVGCIEDLPLANSSLPTLEKIVSKIERAQIYSIAISKLDACKAAALHTNRPNNVNSLLPFIAITDKLALDECMNQGCDCEIVISNGTALVPKNILMSGRGLETNTADLNKKIAVEEKQIKEEASKQAQLERDQKQMQERVRIAQEKKVAEEKQIKEEASKQAQLERDQKQMQEQVKIAQDKKIAEEKRLQLDIAKNSADTEKSKLALDKAKAEESKALAQLAKLDALEKEKADLVAQLKQEKDAREKAVIQQRSEDDKVAALRKELEKEIRANIQKEANSPQSQASSPNKVAPIVYANRKALVIGNDSYAKVTPLVNAREDARVMAESLASLGFNVSMKLDVTQKQFLAELRSFKNQVKAGDEVALFYAGHGVQIASTNYLLPIDIHGQSEEEVRDDAISLQRLLDDMDDKKVKFTLAVIDACRDNPFKGSTRSAIGARGLAPTTAATGQMIVFSAGTGQQALDKVGPADKSKNGLFTRIFVKEMQKEGLTVDRVVRNVRTEVVAVAKSVGHNQVPAIYDQVVGEFYFKQ